MANLSFENGQQWAFDATTLGMAEECMFKYHLGIQQGWRSKEKGGDIIFGGLFASALEFYYLKTSGDFEQRVRETIRNTMIATWDEKAQAHIFFQSKNKQWITLLRAIVDYLYTYEKHPEQHPLQTVQLENGLPAIEVSFNFEAPNGKFHFCGHIDRVVQWDTQYFWLDQKTTNMQLSPRFFDYYNPAMQSFTYTYAGNYIFDFKLSGGIIDAVQILAGETRFSRQRLYITATHMQEWLEDIELLVEMIQAANQSGHYRRNISSCHKYGRRCEFFDYCHGSVGLRNATLEENFNRTDGWDPVARSSSEDH